MKRTQAIELPQEEIAKQKEWMAEFAALEDRPRTYCVVTYGCQMNAHDSETLEGMLAEMGMTPASTREEADFVIFRVVSGHKTHLRVRWRRGCAPNRGSIFRRRGIPFRALHLRTS